MRLAPRDERDLIVSQKNDHAPSYWRYGALQRWSCLKYYFREIFDVVRFSTFATKSAQSGPDVHRWRCRLIGGKRTRPLKAASVSKSKSDSIAERVQQIVLSFIVLVAYPKAFDLVAQVIA
jgi:hypothetical protein